MIAEDDDSGGDSNAKLVFKAPREGTYRIVVTSFDRNETGSFLHPDRAALGDRAAEDRALERSSKDKAATDKK